MGRPRVLIVHRNNRADAKRIEQALGPNARVKTIWEPDKIDELIVKPPNGRYDAIVLFPMKSGRQAMHERLIRSIKAPHIYAVGRPHEWGKCIEESCAHHCRSAEIASRQVQEHLSLN